MDEEGEEEQREKQEEMMILEPTASAASVARGMQEEYDISSVSLRASQNIPTGMLASPDLSFPWRLFIMLEEATSKGLDNIVSWIDNGTAFKVYDQNEFERTILPHYFIKMTKYHSFTRQLYAYNFTWIRKGKSKGAYFNAKFSKHTPNNCSLMTRRKDKRNLQQGRHHQQQNNKSPSLFHSTFSMGEASYRIVQQEESSATIASIPSSAATMMPFHQTISTSNEWHLNAQQDQSHTTLASLPPPETTMSFHSTFSTADESHLRAQQVPSSATTVPFHSTISTADESHLRTWEESHTNIDGIPSSSTGAVATTAATIASMFEPRPIEEMMKRSTDNITDESEMASYF